MNELRNLTRDLLRPNAVAWFTLAFAGIVVAFLAAGRAWRPENELSLGPLSVPVLTLAFVATMIIGGAHRSRLDTTASVLVRSLGLPYVIATTALALIGLASTALTGLAPFGLAFYGSFIGWPILAGGAIARVSLRSLERYSRVVCLVAAAGLLIGSRLRLVPDNINLAGMMVASAGLYVAARPQVMRPRAMAPGAVTVCVLVLLLDGRRTLVAATVVGLLVSRWGRALWRRPDLLVKVGLGLIVALMLARIATPSIVEQVDYVTSAIRFFDDEQRSDTDDRRARLLADGRSIIEIDPVFGVGGGRYLEVLGDLRPGEDRLARPHNMVLFVWAELGLIGVGLTVVLLIAPLLHLRHRTETWIVLIPPTVSMLTNDYYFSPGYFMAVLFAAGTHQGERRHDLAIEADDPGGSERRRRALAAADRNGRPDPREVAPTGRADRRH